MDHDPVERLDDHGPRYAETDLDSFPVDAWATWTNLIFAVVIVYWLWRLRGNFSRHRMLAIALPILTIGWIGGTIYHATRSHVLWLLLDWLPIMILVLMAAAWQWRRLLPSWNLALICTMIPPLIAAALFALFGPSTANITTSYGLVAFGVLVPTVITCVRQPAAWPWFLSAVGCFVIALTFRTLDHELGKAGWPHGSHYLWHLGGGAASFCMFALIHQLRESDLRS